MWRAYCEYYRARRKGDVDENAHVSITCATIYESLETERERGFLES